jgi:hypothetical protein
MELIDWVILIVSGLLAGAAAPFIVRSISKKQLMVRNFSRKAKIISPVSCLLFFIYRGYMNNEIINLLSYQLLILACITSLLYVIKRNIILSKASFLITILLFITVLLMRFWIELIFTNSAAISLGLLILVQVYAMINDQLYKERMNLQKRKQLRT